jgi:hypothetical protein
MREIATDLNRLHRSFDRHLAQMQNGILEVRMVPLGQVFDKLARIVRQISRENDKQVNLVITGAETEIATSWTFWHWDPEDGIHGDPIATGRLTGLRFVEPPPNAFVRPADARQEPLPPSGAAAEGGAE